MRFLKQFQSLLRSFLIGSVLILSVTLSWKSSASALAAQPTPVTPSTVQYELERSHHPEKVGQKLQTQSQEYKKELAKSPKPIPNAAKTVGDKTQSLVEKTSDRLRETLNQTPSESNHR